MGGRAPVLDVSTVCLLSQTAPKKHSQGKKSPHTFAISWISPKMYLPSLIIIQSWLLNIQTVHIRSLSDLRFVFCSLDLDVLCTQRIIGFFILITHKSTGLENLITWLACLYTRVNVSGFVLPFTHKTWIRIQNFPVSSWIQKLLNLELKVEHCMRILMNPNSPVV